MINRHVTYYIELYENGKIKLNKERILLINYLKGHVLNRDDIYFDDEKIENFIKFTEKWYFPLLPFQKFLAAFVFLYYKESNAVFYDQFFWLMARGAGKNGLISALSHFFISPLHGIPRYNISIVANSELQAKTSFEEIYDTIEMNGPLNRAFYRTKLRITGNDTKSILQYHTSNADTKDGLRDGCVIYDEVHQYQTFDVVNVFSSGLGKVPHSREFFIGTDGFVRDGFLDKTKERAMDILKGKVTDDPLFPFICKIDEEKEMHSPELWEKANPMFSEPMNEYGEGLQRKVMTQYRQLASNPAGREEFVTKRMNMPLNDLSKSVATWDEIMATNRPFPDLQYKSCIGGLDFASIRDFAAVGLLFKDGDDYIWKTHSFVRKGFLEEFTLKAPINDWDEQGLLTIVDEPVINIRHIVNWFVDMRNHYGLTKIITDSFRLDLVKTALENEGFEVEYLRTLSTHSILAPRVETLFANRNIIFGDNPLMRWYTNNVYVHIKKDGNKQFLKKDEIRRKTDGFHAFLHALWRADDLIDEEMDIFVDAINF